MSFSFLTWLAEWREQRSHKRPIRLIRPPLTLEYLESRLAPAIITVNSPLDANAPNTVLTLRQAIQLADGTLLYNNLTKQEQAQVDITGGTPDKSASNTILFDLAAGTTIKIQNAPLPDVTRPVTIQGGGKVTIDGSQLDPKKLNPNAIIGIDLVAGSDDSGIYGLTVQNFFKYGIRSREKINWSNWSC